jgi:hypothetical protein
MGCNKIVFARLSTAFIPFVSQLVQADVPVFELSRVLELFGWGEVIVGHGGLVRMAVLRCIENQLTLTTRTGAVVATIAADLIARSDDMLAQAHALFYTHVSVLQRMHTEPYIDAGAVQAAIQFAMDVATPLQDLVIFCAGGDPSARVDDWKEISKCACRVLMQVVDSLLPVIQSNVRAHISQDAVEIRKPDPFLSRQACSTMLTNLLCACTLGLRLQCGSSASTCLWKVICFTCDTLDALCALMESRPATTLYLTASRLLYDFVACIRTCVIFLEQHHVREYSQLDDIYGRVLRSLPTCIVACKAASLPPKSCLSEGALEVAHEDLKRFSDVTRVVLLCKWGCLARAWGIQLALHPAQLLCERESVFQLIERCVEEFDIVSEEVIPYLCECLRSIIEANSETLVRDEDFRAKVKLCVEVGKASVRIVLW